MVHLLLYSGLRPSSIKSYYLIVPEVLMLFSFTKKCHELSDFYPNSVSLFPISPQRNQVMSV